jgi:hypothetical protein
MVLRKALMCLGINTVLKVISVFEMLDAAAANRHMIRMLAELS